MYVAHILPIELHEHVVYQLRRRRLLISLYSRNFDKQFNNAMQYSLMLCIVILFIVLL